MSHYYSFEVEGTKYQVPIAIPEDGSYALLHNIVLDPDDGELKKRLDKLGFSKPDKVWLEDMDGNVVREVEYDAK